MLPPPPRPPSGAPPPAAAPSTDNKPNLPAALRARLIARGVLKEDGTQGADGGGPAVNGSSGSGAPPPGAPPPGWPQQQQHPYQHQLPAPAPPPQEEPLLPGWSEAVCPTHNRPYYYNSTTGRCYTRAFARCCDGPTLPQSLSQLLRRFPRTARCERLAGACSMHSGTSARRAKTKPAAPALPTAPVSSGCMS